ncbi:hypothetical protein FQR65_LT08001 [Abscondita terminalis]|nr:hypothetical protein FQR65_LT08001 [Abscondita terminalis]
MPLTRHTAWPAGSPSSAAAPVAAARRCAVPRCGHSPRVVGGQVHVAGRGQGRAAGRDGDGGGAVLARDVGRIHQVARAARVGDDDHAVAGPQQRGAHDLHVAVAGGQAGHAQAEELVLRILGHDARIARAIELDAPAGLPGGGYGAGCRVQCRGAGCVAVLQKAATELSTTFTSTSPVLSSLSTLRWMKGTPSLTLPASLS